MVEYASVRSSLYDIEALVAQLNERADDGWKVVQILPTGGDVTAVLQRSTEPEPSDDAGGEGAALAGVAALEVAEAEAIEAEVAEAEVELADEVVAEEVALEEAAEELAVEEAVEEAAVEEAVDEAAAEAAVDEPAGWAAAPVAAVAAEEIVTDVPTDASAGVDEATDTVTGEVAEAAVVAEAVEAPAPPAAPEPAPAAPTPPPAPAPATPSIPAGWYPDPSGRFELRYWDGGAWTEHVARQGQMYTDPPVA